MLLKNKIKRGENKMNLLSFFYSLLIDFGMVTDQWSVSFMTIWYLHRYGCILWIP